MGISKSWGSIKPTPKQFVVDESPEDYKFKKKLRKQLIRFDNQFKTNGE